jgi:septum site-determining protein MinC
VTQTSSNHIRFRGCSFPVLALEPEGPVESWIERLDACLARSPAFFARKSIVIDVSSLGLERSGVAGLVEQLSERGIRIMGLTGVEPSWASSDLPPILTNGRTVPIAAELAAGGDDAAAPPSLLSSVEQTAFDEIARTLGGSKQDPGQARASDLPPGPKAVVPLVVNSPVRSGQSVFYPEGDVTVIGSISSGADVIAGGSIHVYGTVRGRVMAGAYGETRARIFCRRLEAELIAVGGFYMTADEIREDLRNQAVHAWLEDESLRIAKLD